MAKELKAFKTRIYPTKKQKQYFQRCFGVRRFAWNWGLEHWDEYKSWTKLDKAWNHSEMKEEKPYLYEVNSMIKNMTFKRLNETWKMHKKNPKKYGEPRFKSKKKDTNRFSMFVKNKLALVPNGKWISMTTTRAFGRINFKAAEDLSFLNDNRIAEWTISERAGMYFISIVYEKINHKVEHKHAISKLGIDGGMKTMLTGFDGDKFFETNLPKRILNLEKKLDRLNRQFSRKIKGSFRWRNLKIRINKLYLRIANIKKDFLDKLVNHLAKTYKVINFESYSFTGALKFTKGARTLYRLSPSMLQSKLELKVEEFGGKFKLIKGEPTTQTCSSCGHRYVGKEKLTLKDRMFNCDSCNLSLGRDKNSAINIFNLA